MSEFCFDGDLYLQRLGLVGKVKVNAEWLEKIHRAQHRSIAFENFDIALGRGINLNPENLFNKLVKKPRGGYCNELNQLIRMALQHFGFEVKPLLCRVHITGKTTARGHQVNLVTINDLQYIVDVGMGMQTPSTPLPLVYDHEIKANHQQFKFIKHELFGTMLQVMINNQWRDLYSSNMGYVCDADIECADFFTSNNPKAFFVFARVASLPTDECMLTLFNTTLTKHFPDRKEQIEIEEGQTYIDAMKEYFKIELDAQYEDFKPLGNDKSKHF